MILATIRFPSGVEIHLGQDILWTGAEPFAGWANDYMRNLPATIYRPDPPHDIAVEVADLYGGELVMAIESSDDLPKDAVP